MVADFKQTIRENRRKSIMIVALAIFLYALTGLFVDFIFYILKYNTALPIGNINSPEPENLFNYLLSFFYELSHFLIFPVFSCVMISIAIISIFFGLIDQKQLMLSGQQYKIVNQENNLSFEEKRLLNIVDEVKIASGVGYTPKVFIMESSIMNAFASGFNEKNALICVSRGLMQQLDRNELRAVVAHEITHIKNNDIKLSLFFASLTAAVIVASDALYYMLIGGSNRKSNNSAAVIVIGLLIAFLLLRFVLPVMLMCLRLFVSRKREFMADAGAVEITRDPQSMGRALVKISNYYKSGKIEDKNNSGRKSAYIFKPVSNGMFSGFFDSINNMFSTHPTIEQRLEKLKYKG